MSSVSVPDVDHPERVSLELDRVVGHLRRHDLGRGDLAREEGIPEELADGEVAVHLVDRPGGGHHLGAEPLGELGGPEPVVPVAVGDEDVRQVLPGGLDPVADSRGLGDRHRRVDEDGVPVAGDQGDRERGEHALVAVRHEVVTSWGTGSATKTS